MLWFLFDWVPNVEFLPPNDWCIFEFIHFRVCDGIKNYFYSHKKNTWDETRSSDGNKITRFCTYREFIVRLLDDSVNEIVLNQKKYTFEEFIAIAQNICSFYSVCERVGFGWITQTVRFNRKLSYFMIYLCIETGESSWHKDEITKKWIFVFGIYWNDFALSSSVENSSSIFFCVQKLLMYPQRMTQSEVWWLKWLFYIEIIFFP